MGDERKTHIGTPSNSEEENHQLDDDLLVLWTTFQTSSRVCMMLRRREKILRVEVDLGSTASSAPTESAPTPLVPGHASAGWKQLWGVSRFLVMIVILIPATIFLMTNLYHQEQALQEAWFVTTVATMLNLTNSAAISTFLPPSFYDNNDQQQQSQKLPTAKQRNVTLNAASHVENSSFAPPPSPPTISYTNASSSSATSPRGRFHLVFSTSCNSYQHWQAYLFFHRARVLQQPGTVTRIVSGCQARQRTRLRQLFAQQIAPMRPGSFLIHFTPHYARLLGDENFYYFNKPFGLRHWMRYTLKFPNTTIHDHDMVVLLDPDQLLLRPFRDNNFSDVQWVDRPSWTDLPRIQPGRPLGQKYGLGGYWRPHYNLSSILPPDSAGRVTDLADDEFEQYVVGPPLLATAPDMWRMVNQWCAFLVPLHAQSDYFLGEMYAHSLAVAHLDWPHGIGRSFMVSDVTVPANQEGWDFLEQISVQDVCQAHYHHSEAPGWPWVLHYCQDYGLGPFYFFKAAIPPELVMSCHHPLLLEPPLHLAELYNSTLLPEVGNRTWNEFEVKANAWLLCTLIAAVNAAALYFRQTNCQNEVSVNFNKTFSPQVAP